MKVLIVDDEKQIRELLADIICCYLDVKPEDITQSWNGEQAANIYQKNGHFDLVLTDFQMPVMNGIELCKDLMTYEEPPKVIMITGCSANELEGLPESVILFMKGRPYRELVDIILQQKG